MFGSVRQLGRCSCRCLLQNSSSNPTCTVNSVRQYQNHTTIVLERKHAINMVGKGKYPLLKKRHYILKVVPPSGKAVTTMKCILTREIEGLGLKGTMVEVPKAQFRNRLYPAGLALYASPENIEKYNLMRKDSAEEGITYEMKQLMKKMASFHLQVFMNKEEDWMLDTSLIRIAFRKMGVSVKEENILMPEEPITGMGDFSFKLQLDNKLACAVNATVYPIGEDGLPPNRKYPPVWGKVKKDPVIYLKTMSAKEMMTETMKETKTETTKTETEEVTENICDENINENDDPKDR